MSGFYPSLGTPIALANKLALIWLFVCEFGLPCGRHSACSVHHGMPIWQYLHRICPWIYLPKDDLFAAIAVVILLIGTATGSANAILVMSTILLAVMVVFYRKQLGSGALLTALVAALTAVVVGLILAWR